MKDETRRNMAPEESGFKDIASQALEPYRKYYETARAASDAGELKVVKEMILEPNRGHGFEVKKGQVLRYVLIDGTQTLDVTYVSKRNPLDEHACPYPTMTHGALQQNEGDIYLTNPPYWRPLITMIKDTVDGEAMKKKLGPSASHCWAVNNARCNTQAFEFNAGLVDTCSCDLNMTQGLMEVAGEEVAKARLLNSPVFIHFTAATFTPDERTRLELHSAKGHFKRGDHIELLMHDDVYVGLSPCPEGDFHHVMEDFDKWTTWPIKVQILERPGEPLPTIDYVPKKSMKPMDFLKAGRPSMMKSRGATRTALATSRIDPDSSN